MKTPVFIALLVCMGVFFMVRYGQDLGHKQQQSTFQQCMDSLYYSGTDGECEWCDYISKPMRRNIVEADTNCNGSIDLWIDELVYNDIIPNHLEDLTPYEARTIRNNSIPF